MAQVAECLPSKQEVLISNPSSANKKRKNFEIYVYKLVQNKANYILVRYGRP
jgi:hypothetical protein